MHLINWKYSRDYNRRKNRKGHFWIQHYQCIPVESDRYALALMRYINRNPIRAGMTKEVGEWKWSGSRFYMDQEKNELLEPHPSYLALAINDIQRKENYKKFVQMILPTEDNREVSFSESNYIGSKNFGEKLKKFICG